MTRLLRNIFDFASRSILVAPIILIASNTMAHAQGQVSTLQQLPPSAGSQNQSGGNIIEKLFSNPNTANTYANMNANPYASPYSSINNVSQSPTNFWSGLFHKDIVDSGTVLTGTLEDNDLSSKSSKIGDVFSILLTDGYQLNHVQLIPQNTKIIGSVVAVTPAKKTVNGMPGSLQINLQTLVLPNSTSMPINATIQYNPNQGNKIDMKKGRGIPIGEYAQSLEYGAVASAGALSRQLGFSFPYKTQTGSGPDFVIHKGDLLPVKLTQPLDMTAFVNNQAAQAPTNQPSNTAPTSMPSGMPANGNQIPSGLPANNGQIPGLMPSNLPVNNAPMPMSENQNPNYPAGWPGSQSVTPDPANTLPGNNAPAGPEPF